MNLRHRWWLAGALLCLSAAATQRARTEELPVEASPPGVVLARDALAPDRGSASGSTEAGLPRLRQEADAAYRARNFGEAQVAFERLVALDPGDAQAWLRLGNLHQQAGRDAQAMDAYRSASRVSADDEAAALARGKALLNMALLGVQAASRAIDELDAMRVPTLGPSRDAAARQVGAVRRRANRAGARLEARRSPDAVAEGLPSGAGPVRSPPAPADFQPYTVDRWIATPRRPGAGRAAARASVHEPLTDTPLPAPPAVDVIRAVPDAPPGPGGAKKR